MELRTLILLAFAMPKLGGATFNWETPYQLPPPAPFDQHSFTEVSEMLQLLIRRACMTAHVDCGKHGTCVVDSNGHIGCRCQKEKTFIWGGEVCEIKGELLPISSESIIGLTTGVIVLLLIAMTVIIADGYFNCRKKFGSRQNRCNEVLERRDHSYTVSQRVHQSRSLSQTASTDVRETTFSVELTDELPAYSDAVPTASFNGALPSRQDAIKQFISTSDIENDDVTSSEMVSVDTASFTYAYTSAAPSTSSAAAGSDIFYRDRNFRNAVWQQEETDEDEYQGNAFTLPRVCAQRNAPNKETRSLSSLACESTLNQLSDTYHNRQPTALDSYSPGSSPPTINCSLESRRTAKRTYRVLFMGSLGPEPVFLYEPWRSNPDASEGADARCRSTRPPDPWDRVFSRRMHKYKSDEDADSDSSSSSDTLVAESRREEQVFDPVTNIRNNELIARSISFRSTDSSAIASTSDSEVSVFFDEQFVKLSTNSSLLPNWGGVDSRRTDMPNVDRPLTIVSIEKAAGLVSKSEQVDKPESKASAQFASKRATSKPSIVTKSFNQEKARAASSVPESGGKRHTLSNPLSAHVKEGVVVKPDTCSKSQLVTALCKLDAENKAVSTREEIGEHDKHNNKKETNPDLITEGSNENRQIGECDLPTCNVKLNGEPLSSKPVCTGDIDNDKNDKLKHAKSDGIVKNRPMLEWKYAKGDAQGESHFVEVFELDSSLENETFQTKSSPQNRDSSKAERRQAMTTDSDREKDQTAICIRL